MLGKILDKKYKITQLIGQGGMGSVYRGEHVHLRRDCAIKVVRREHAADPVALKRFKLEAEAASILKHNNIIEIYDFGITDDDLAYIVMEFLHGESLDSVLERNRYLHYEEAVPLFLQVCDALAHAHSKNVLHRDIKPPNIMLVQNEETREIRVKIVDFGIAKLLPGQGRSVEKLTQTGEVFGSPMYMSPEQCMGQDMDGRADIYALGCVFYQTLTGRLPFMGENFVQVVVKHLNEMPPPFASMAPNIAIPSALEDIVMRCLAKDRATRFASVNDMRASLLQIRASKQHKHSAPAKAEAVSAASGELTQDDRVEVTEKIEDLIMRSFDSSLPMRISDLVASTCWLAGEQVLQFSGVLKSIPPDTAPGTLVVNDFVAQVIHASPQKNVLNDFFEEISYAIPSLTQENWRVMRASPQDYEQDYVGERRVNHPAAVANRLRDKLRLMAKGLQLKSGKVVYLSEALIAQTLERITAYHLALYDRQHGYVPDLGGIVMNWLIAGSLTVPGTGAENPPIGGRATILVRDDQEPVQSTSNKADDKVNKLHEGTVQLSGEHTNKIFVGNENSSRNQNKDLNTSQRQYENQSQFQNHSGNQTDSQSDVDETGDDENSYMGFDIETLIPVIERLERKFGQNCQNIIEPLNRLYSLYDYYDKYTEAVETKQRLLQIISRKSGECLELARCHEDIGKMDIKLKKFVEAETSLRESLSLKIQFLGSQHREVCETRIHLGKALLGRDRIAAAEELVNAAIENINRWTNRTRRDIADIEYMVGDFYYLAKPTQFPNHRENALPHYEMSYNILKEDLPPKHWDLRYKAMDIARCYYFMERYITAIEFCTEVIEIDKENVEAARGGKTMAHPWTNMAWNYHRLRNYEKAEQAYLNSIKVLEAEGSPKDLSDLLIDLAETYEDSGQTKKAKACRDRAAKLAAL